jgi:hypothetical protein
MVHGSPSNCREITMTSLSIRGGPYAGWSDPPFFFGRPSMDGLFITISFRTAPVAGNADQPRAGAVRP